MANEFEARAKKAEKELQELKEKLWEAREELVSLKRYAQFSQPELDLLNDPSFKEKITALYEQKNEITPAPAAIDPDVLERTEKLNGAANNVEPAVAAGGTPKVNEPVIPVTTEARVEEDKRQKMDAYGVELLRWANTNKGLENSDGSITTKINDKAVIDNRLEAGEIARVFGKNAKESEKHRGYLVKGFDTDGDGKLSSHEIDRMQKIAGEAGLYIDKAALGKVMDVKEAGKSPIATPAKTNAITKNTHEH